MGREAPSSESLRKKRAGNEVRGQQQQFSYYNVSMAAGEEQQHTTPCGTRTNSDSTHIQIHTEDAFTGISLTTLDN